MSESESLQTCRLYEFSVFRLDVNEGLFAAGEPVKLAPKVLQTLTLFVENPGRIITKDEFFEKIWTDSFVEDGALSFNISKLRKALAEFDSDTEFIETVSKRGFRFLADVRKAEPEKSTLEILIERHQVQEVVHEEEQSIEAETQPKLKAPTKSRLKTVALLAGVGLLLAALAGLMSQIRKNAESRSYDSLPSVDLVFWRSAGSSIYSDYSSAHNGNVIAYSSTESGSSEIIVRPVNGRKIQITEDKWHNFSPIWSPKDTELAYVSVRGSQMGIYICPAFGGISKSVMVVEKGDFLLRSWSRDGTAIFYESGGNLFRVEVANGVISQITNFPPDESGYFSISPDERRIAYRKETDGQTDIWIKPIGEGEPFRVTYDKDKEYKNKWHADGKRIIYTVRRDGVYHISAISTDGGDPIHLTRGDGKYELVDVSPDGTKIFYKKELGRFDIWRVNTDSGEESVVASEPEYEFWPNITPDGKSIAYQVTPTQFMHLGMYRSSIVVRSQDDKNVQHSFLGWGQRWLPDSRRLAFLRWSDEKERFDFWLFDTVGGNEYQITFDGAAAPGHSAFPLNRSQASASDWSPVGDRLVYLAAGRRNVLMISPGDEKALNLTGSEDRQTTYFCPIWSPDGNRIAYLSLEMPEGLPDKARWRVWIYEGGRAKKVYETSKSLRFLGWSATGGDLFLEATEGYMRADFLDIELLRVSTNGETHAVGSFDKISALSMALSPDGQSVAYVARPDGKEGIFTASTLRNEKKQILSNPDPDFHLGALTWSPDGKTIFVDKQEETNVISMFQHFE